jgi:uncharacterized protein YecA (UPF0149 family)
MTPTNKQYWIDRFSQQIADPKTTEDMREWYSCEVKKLQLNATIIMVVAVNNMVIVQTIL